LPHQLWTGKDFLSSPLATAYWWTLWGAAVAAVLTYRVGLPLLRNRRHRLVVADVAPAGGNVTTVTITGRDLHRLPAAGGQFFQWRF
ncbi:MAG: oxidoreductase, partial [Austwickia sp.]|nr:oxidoreductase [Austwickia sp.]